MDDLLKLLSDLILKDEKKSQELNKIKSEVDHLTYKITMVKLRSDQTFDGFRDLKDQFTKLHQDFSYLQERFNTFQDKHFVDKAQQAKSIPLDII